MFNLKAGGGGGSHLPGNRKRMRLDGNLGLIEMTEENGIYVNINSESMNFLGLLSSYRILLFLFLRDVGKLPNSLV